MTNMTNRAEKKENKAWQPSLLTLPEKLELLYISPYYLQAAFFLVGTISWFLTETVFKTHLPFWTSLWGWSLVLTNMLSLPLMNAVGLFLEEAEEKDYLGLLSFWALSYVLVPFQAYASIKGFLKKQEGHWFRTPKTGKITDIFKRGTFYRWISGILPRWSGSQLAASLVSRAMPTYALLSQKSNLKNQNDKLKFKNNFLVSSTYYLNPGLATANNQFSHLRIKPRRRKLRWVSKAALVILLALSITIFSFTRRVPETLAASKTFYLDNIATEDILTAGNEWELLDGANGGSSLSTEIIITKNDNTGYRQLQPGVTNSTNADHGTCSGGSPGTADGYGWIFPTAFDSGASIAAGTWTFYIYESDNGGGRTGYFSVCVYEVAISGGAITDSTLFFQYTDNTIDLWDNGGANQTYQTSQSAFSPTEGRYLYAEFYHNITGTGGGPGAQISSFGTGDATYGNPYILTPDFVIPEKAIIFIATAPFIPMVVMWVRKKKWFF
jgi:hypothetical protein